jgi:hypothetical protein
MAVCIGLDLPNYRVACRDVVVRAVAHVKAEHVSSGFIQFADYVVVIRRWAKRCHDLDFTITSQVVLSGGLDRCPDAAKSAQVYTCYR